MAEVTLADLQQMLAATAAANKATAEAGQVNAQRISEINSALDKLALSQQEIFRTSTRVESTMPAKCSTLGFNPNVGGAEVGFSSMQPEDSRADQELGCDNATSSPDAAAPAKCSTECLVNGLVDNTKPDNVVSHELVEVVALPMANTISVDPGDHRQPPWPPPLFDIVNCSSADRNSISWPSFKSGMNLVSLSATSSLDVGEDSTPRPSALVTGQHASLPLFPFEPGPSDKHHAVAVPGNSSVGIDKIPVKHGAGTVVGLIYGADVSTKCEVPQEYLKLYSQPWSDFASKVDFSLHHIIPKQLENASRGLLPAHILVMDAHNSIIFQENKSIFCFSCKQNQPDFDCYDHWDPGILKYIHAYTLILFLTRMQFSYWRRKFPGILDICVSVGTCKAGTADIYAICKGVSMGIDCSIMQMHKSCEGKEVLIHEEKFHCLSITLGWLAARSVGQFFLFHCICQWAKAVACMIISNPVYKVEMVNSANSGNLFGSMNISCEHLQHVFIKVIAPKNIAELDELYEQHIFWMSYYHHCSHMRYEGSEDSCLHVSTWEFIQFVAATSHGKTVSSQTVKIGLFLHLKKLLQQRLFQLAFLIRNVAPWNPSEHNSASKFTMPVRLHWSLPQASVSIHLLGAHSLAWQAEFSGSHDVVQLEITSQEVQLRPIPWPSFCEYAAAVHFQNSLVVVLLVSLTALLFFLVILKLEVHEVNHDDWSYPPSPIPEHTVIKFTDRASKSSGISRDVGKITFKLQFNILMIDDP